MTVCGRRLLIAEDEPLLRVSMADALRKEGWTVDAVDPAESFFNRFGDEVLNIAGGGAGVADAHPDPVESYVRLLLHAGLPPGKNTPHQHKKEHKVG